MELVYILIWGVIWGAICQAVGNSKNINGFWWGFCLGFIGLIIVLCSKDRKVSKIDISTNNTSKYSQLEKLSKLKNSGAISDEEFEQEKEKLLK